MHTCLSYREECCNIMMFMMVFLEEEDEEEEEGGGSACDWSSETRRTQESLNETSANPS